MHDTDVLQHSWQGITLTPVQVLIDADGDPVMFADPDEPGETMYGCDTCGEAMTTHLNTPCSGGLIDDED